MLGLLAQTYTYTYTTTSTSSGLGAGFWIGYTIFILAMWLIGGFFLGKVFVKAGRPFWAGFVPFYNSWILFELGGKSGANIFWVLVPFVGSIIFLVQFIIAMLEFGRRFGKSTLFSVFGLIIFSIVGLIILAFDQSKYSGDGTGTAAAPAAPAAPAVPPSDQSTPPTPPAAA